MIETSFYELRMKSVINVVDGKNLGNICDVVMEICSGKILGFVVPGKKKWYYFFKTCEDVFIPYHNICKIGEDSILVELTSTETKNFQTTSFSEASCPNLNCKIKNPCEMHQKPCTTNSLNNTIVKNQGEESRRDLKEYLND